MASTEVLLPSPPASSVGGGGVVDPMAALPAICGPHRGVRRPSGGTAESESDSPPSKKTKKARRRRRKRFRQRGERNGLRTKPVAPFNTTQFLMAEHDLLKDTDIMTHPRRHRDSSFSLDSEDPDKDFYSSPEDEEEFLTKEFWTAYEDVHAERLDTMTKAQLVQEYLALEEKVDLLERQLRAVRARHRSKLQQEEDDDDAVGPGEVRVDSETAQKITIFQSEINTLEQENKRLREENFKLRRTSLTRSSSSSSSSSSTSSSSDSSSSSSDGNTSSDSEMDEGAGEKSKVVVLVAGSGSPRAAPTPTQASSATPASAPPPPPPPCRPDSPAQDPPSSSLSPKQKDHVTAAATSPAATAGALEEEVSSTTAV